MTVRKGNNLTDKLKQNGADAKTITIVKQQIPQPYRW